MGESRKSSQASRGSGGRLGAGGHHQHRGAAVGPDPAGQGEGGRGLLAQFHHERRPAPLRLLVGDGGGVGHRHRAAAGGQQGFHQRGGGLFGVDGGEHHRIGRYSRNSKRETWRW